MALLERLEIVIEADARTAEREFDRIGRQASESLESIEKAAAEVGDNAAGKLAGAAPEFARAGERLSDAAGKELDLSAAAEKAAADLPRAVEGQRGEMEQAGRRAGDAAGSGVAAGVRDAGGQVRGAGDALGSDVGSGVSGGILESLGGLGGDLSRAMDDALGSLPPAVAGPAAAVGAAVATGLAVGFAGELENQKLGDIVAARLGEGVAESERFARVTTDVFRDAWGESKAEVADAVDAVYSSLGESRTSEEALTRLTTKAQAMADVFGIDVQQAVAAVDQVQFNGLAASADEAFDIVISGLQEVSSYTRDEVLEALNEYSDDFGMLGISGERAMDLLVRASEGGTYAVDKAGDAVKELGIKVADLNDTAAQNKLEDLGFDAQNMATRVAAGGDSADEAIREIATALLAIEDPAERYTATLDLLGEPMADLGRTIGPELLQVLAGQTDGMRDATGASDELTESLKDTGTAFETVKRELIGGFEEFANMQLTPLADYLNDEEQTAGDAAHAVGEFVGNQFVGGFKAVVGGGLGAIAEPFLPDDFWDKYGPVASFQAAWRGDWWGSEDSAVADEVGQDIGNRLAEGAGAGVEATAGAIASGIGAIAGSVDTDDAVSAMQDLNAELAESGDLAKFAEERIDKFFDVIEDSSSMDDLLSSTLDLNDALGDIGDGFVRLRDIDLEAIISGAVIPSDEVADSLRNIMAAGEAAQQQIAAVLQFQGADAAVAKADQVRGLIVDMATAAGLSKDEINKLLETMGLADWQIEAAITLSGVDEVLAQVGLIRDLLTGTDAEIPPEINVAIATALSNEDWESAQNLLNAYMEDMQDGVIDNPLLIGLQIADPSTTLEELQEWFNNPDIPDMLKVQAGVAIDEGRLQDAKNLLALWIEDTSDGTIDNPLLIAMGLGDTEPASGEVEAWKRDEEGKPPAKLPIDADSQPARGVAGRLFQDIESLNPKITIGAKLGSEVGNAVNAGVGKIVGIATGNVYDPGDIGGRPGRATGGPLMEGVQYEVNERGQELFVSSDGGYMVNASNLKQLMDNMARLAEGGGSGMSVVQNITAPGPMEAASESARKLRDASYLVGV